MPCLARLRHRHSFATPREVSTPVTLGRTPTRELPTTDELERGCWPGTGQSAVWRAIASIATRRFFVLGSGFSIGP